MEVHPAYAVVLDEAGRFLKAANLRYQVGDTVRDIVELRGLTKSHICQSVDGLTRRGWLSGVQDGQDRRRVHLSLLPAAQTAVAAAQAVQRDFFVRLYRGVSQEERETLERVQEKMLSNLKEAQQ